MQAFAHDITQPKSELLYSATNVIYKLLRVVGSEVCSFRRNHQIAYRLVERARDLYDAINARIHLVDLNNSFEDYEIYTQAIDPLEEVLLNIIPIAFDERELDHLSTSSWAEYVQVTGQWRSNRLAIRRSFQDMRMKPQFQALMSTLMDDEDDLFNAYTRDDLSYLDYLLRIIGANIQQIVEPKVKEYVEQIANGLHETAALQRSNSGKHLRGSEDLNAIPIQCAHFASRMVVTMVNASVPKDIRDQLALNTTLWDTLAQLVLDIFAFMASQLAPRDSEQVSESVTRVDVSITITQFTTRYDDLVKMADKVPVPPAIEIPQGYSRLLPLVGKVDRTYHAQSLLLVALCRQAVASFGTKKSTSSRDVLEKALNQTIAALEAAGQDVGSGRSTPVNEDSNDNVPKGYNHLNGDTKGQGRTNNCSRLYKQSADKLTACFQTLEIQYDVDPQGKFKQAQSKDNARVAEVNEKLNKYEHPSTIGVVVNVYENNRNGQKIKTLPFVSISSNARLEYVKYLVANQLEDRVLAQTGHFERENGSAGQPTFLSLDSEMKDAIDNTGVVVFIVHRPGA
ncbi:hypothetical protein B0J17DRAFT_634189 [Rhizoctonia solani]|nr:hypothetical protein B0J17DRAFT_634189 [Rhizoctonia solani]